MHYNKYLEFARNTPEFIKFTVEFLIETGIRPKELWQISKSNLNYITGDLAYTQPKTKIRRFVKLSPDMLQKARNFRKLYGNFSNVYRNYKNLKRSLMQFVCFSCFVPKGHNCLYYFRYLFVLDKIERNWSEEKIADALGHKDMATVRDYIEHALFIKLHSYYLEVENGKA